MLNEHMEEPVLLDTMYKTEPPLLTTLTCIFITRRTSCGTERDQRLKNTARHIFSGILPCLLSVLALGQPAC